MTPHNPAPNERLPTNNPGSTKERLPTNNPSSTNERLPTNNPSSTNERLPATGIGRILVRPWRDPIMDQVGHDPRSAYVERFWLGVLGPSATWFVRHVADRFDLEPEGFDLDLAECAASIGLGRHNGPTAAFPRMLSRCCQFGLARASGPASLEIRRILAPLSQKQVEKLSPTLQAEHARWIDSSPAAAEVAALSDRARRLALSLLELGEHPVDAERQLHRWRFHPALAREAMTWALDRHLGVSDLDKDPDFATEPHRRPSDPYRRRLEVPGGPASSLSERAAQLQHARERAEAAAKDPR